MFCAGQDTFFCTRKYDAEKGELEEAGDGIGGAPAAQVAAAKVCQGSSPGLSACLSTRGTTPQPETLPHVSCWGQVWQGRPWKCIRLSLCLQGKGKAAAPHAGKGKAAADAGNGGAAPDVAASAASAKDGGR